MNLKEVSASKISNSRKEKTILIEIKTSKGKFLSSAPSGKSRGRFEAKPYSKSLTQDIKFINKLNKDKNYSKIKISEFKDLKEIENFLGEKIGANTLFSLESSILKALAAEQNKQLWEFLSRKRKIKDFPMPVGNAIGGGLHTSLSERKKPDFQEFLFIPKIKKFEEAVKLNLKAYKLAGKILNAKKINDEGAWQTSLSNNRILQIMNKIKDEIPKLRLGLDIAASTFYENKKYRYKNKEQKLNKQQQINFVSLLSRVFRLSYIEDPLEEKDFSGFAELNKIINKKTMMVGDDLTVTNLFRLKKAVQKKAIDAIIVKPNQQGSLIKVKEICDFCKKRDIKIVFSHRSGETLDTVISDLALAWEADFIKTGIFGNEREAKLKRLIEIEKRM